MIGMAYAHTLHKKEKKKQKKKDPFIYYRSQNPHWLSKYMVSLFIADMIRCFSRFYSYL